MKANFQNPIPLNEIRNFKIKQDDYRYLFTIPIDVRFIKIETLFRRFKHITGDYDIRDTNISPLVCTWSMFFKYFRCKAIEESDPIFFNLFREQDKRINQDTINSVPWKLYQYSDSTDIVNELRDEFMDIIPEEYHLDVIKFLEEIWDIYFFPYMPMLINQVLIFNIQNYDINVYTLGDIASYRYKESKRPVLHIPPYASVKDGNYCIDY
jgi:hypothetical protein